MMEDLAYNGELEQGEQCCLRDAKKDGATYMVTGECLALQDNLVPALGVWTVKGIHQEMEIRGQSLHDSHLGRLSAHDGCHDLGRSGICIEPCRERRIA
jgi:hypothetical protein